MVEKLMLLGLVVLLVLGAVSEVGDALIPLIDVAAKFETTRCGETATTCIETVKP